MSLQPGTASLTPDADVGSLLTQEALDDSWFDWKKKVQTSRSSAPPKEEPPVVSPDPPPLSIGDPVADRWFR